MTNKVVFEVDESQIEVFEAGLGMLLQEVSRFKFLDVRGEILQASQIAQIHAVQQVLANRTRK